MRTCVRSLVRGAHCSPRPAQAQTMRSNSGDQRRRPQRLWGPPRRRRVASHSVFLAFGALAPTVLPPKEEGPTEVGPFHEGYAASGSRLVLAKRRRQRRAALTVAMLPP